MEETIRPTRVLVVDDEPSVLRALEVILRKKGYEVVALDSPIAATQRLATEDFDVAMLDIRMPELSGIKLLNAVKHRRPEIEVIMMTGHATVDTALAAMKAGAHEYLIKPFIEKPDDVEHVAYVVARAAERKRLQTDPQAGDPARGARDHPGAGGDERADARRGYRMIEAVAYSAATVLVQGESGTGKELVARARPRPQPAPRPAVRRARLRRAHRDAGRERAVRPREGRLHRRGGLAPTGLFERANGGTIFLDEWASCRLDLQPKLLRVLENREVRRVGGTTRCRRSTCASSPPPTATSVKEIRTGNFREDLYYRLSVINITLPPLRDRLDDVPLLAHHFMRRYSDRLGKKVRTIAPGAISLLCVHRWPGNVRELDAIERAVVLCRADSVQPTDLPPSVTGRTTPVLREATTPGDDAEMLTQSYATAKDSALRNFEKRYVEALMRACDGNISAAARKAGMDRSNFKRVLRKYQSDEEDDVEDDAQSTEASL